MKIAIEMKDIQQKFGEHLVLDHISLSVKQGEILGLLGPSGAGKTTLIKILTGQLRPTDGSALLLGKETTQLSGKDHTKMGIMMDSFGLYERLNCYDNLKIFTKIYGIGIERIEEVLQQVGLADAKKTVVMNLSKGMRSRLLLARALMAEPEILFLDEPTSGLDPVTAAEIQNLMLKERQKGMTIFLTTHNMAEAEELCDHIVLLNEGKIVEYGSPEEICRKYNHQRKIRVHLRNGADLELAHDNSCMDTIRKYFEQNEVETIHSTEPDLGTVFMELAGRGLE